VSILANTRKVNRESLIINETNAIDIGFNKQEKPVTSADDSRQTCPLCNTRASVLA